MRRWERAGERADWPAHTNERASGRRRTPWPSERACERASTHIPLESERPSERPSERTTPGNYRKERPSERLVGRQRALASERANGQHRADDARRAEERAGVNERPKNSETSERTPSLASANHPWLGANTYKDKLKMR